MANATECREYLTEHGAGGFLPEQRTDRYPVWQIWRKPLRTPAKGQAVLVINEEERDVNVTYADIDPSLGDAVLATDVWTGAKVDLPKSVAALKGIEPHGNLFLVLRPAETGESSERRGG